MISLGHHGQCQGHPGIKIMNGKNVSQRSGAVARLKTFLKDVASISAMSLG
jgi:hypothetical protein